MVLVYSRLHSYCVLDFEHCVETNREAKIARTREMRFPRHFHGLGMEHLDAAYRVHRMFAPNVQDPAHDAGDDGRCVL